MHKPRIKIVFSPMLFGNRIIQIGGGDYGVAAEIIDDEQGHIWHLLHLLDGTRTPDEVVVAMQQYDPTLQANEVSEALSTLTESGYLEDAACQPPPGVFSPAEIERYQRNFEFFSHFHLPPLSRYNFQERLKRSRVTVLGVGGVGSFAALSLAASGIGDLLLVDDDTVERHNLSRQVLYTERDVGRSKCEVAAERLAEMNPSITVTARRMRVRSSEEARTWMAGQDFVVCTADDPPIRLPEWINAAALVEGVPWLRGGVGGCSIYLSFYVPWQTPCFECEQLVEAAPAPAPSFRPLTSQQREGREEAVNPVIAPLVGVLGNLAALEVIKYLTGVMQPLTYRSLKLDLRTLEATFFEDQRQQTCPACGESRIATARRV